VPTRYMLFPLTLIWLTCSGRAGSILFISMSPQKNDEIILSNKDTSIILTEKSRRQLPHSRIGILRHGRRLAVESGSAEANRT
jgi:hypothetical protein